MKTAVGFMLVLLWASIAIPASAQTNNWISPTRGYWDDYSKWSLGVAPTNPQTAYITNDVSKTVTIDDFTSGTYPKSMTVSNLILSAPAGATNTLELVDAGANTPLNILDTFSIASGGLLHLTGSAISLRSLTNSITNCFFGADGEVVLDSNSIVVADSGIYLGVDTNANGVLVLAGGQLVLTNIGVSAIGVNGTGFVSVAEGQIQTSSGFMFVGSGKGSQGTLMLGGGDYISPQYARLVIGMETGAVGAVTVAGGNLIVTNSFLTLVGGDGAGHLDLLSGANILGPIEVGGNAGAQGTLTMAGTTNLFQASILLGASPGSTGTMWMKSGQLVQTNIYYLANNPTNFSTNFVSTCVGSHGVGSLVMSNGTWLGGAMIVGVRSNSLGTFNLNGGTMTLLSKLVLGSWSNANGEVQVNGGSLNVTNAAGTAVLIVGGPAHPSLPYTNCNNCALAGWSGNGVFVQNGGTVTADQLVMTNGASSVYSFSAGTLQTKATTVSGLQTFIVFITPTNVISSTIVTNPQTFVVGDGIQSATFHLLGGVHTFVTDLKIRTNAFLTGCGTINGNVLVEGTVLADCGGTLVFTGVVTNNATIAAVNGTTLEFFGPVINNGLLDAMGGKVRFHAGVVNNGVLLDPDGDADGDGMTYTQELLAGTDPNNSASYFHITSILPQGTDILVVWSVVTNKSYIVQAATNSLDGSITNAFTDLGTVTVPAAPFITETNYLDVGAVTNTGTRFYRIKVVIP